MAQPDDVHRGLVQHRPDRRDRGVEALDESAHERNIAPPRLVDQRAGLIDLRREGLFHQQRLAQREQCDGLLRMEPSRRREHYGVARARCVELDRERASKLRRERCTPRRVGVDDHTELSAAGLGDDASVVAAHGAGADERETRRGAAHHVSTTGGAAATRASASMPSAARERNNGTSSAAMRTTVAMEPARRPTSTRRNSCLPRAVPTTKTAAPAIHPAATRTYALREMRAWLSTCATMKRVQLAASSAKSRCPSSNTPPNRRWVMKGPSAASATMEMAPSPATKSSSWPRTLRNSP